MPYKNKWGKRKVGVVTPKSYRRCPYWSAGWCTAVNTEYTAGCIGYSACNIYKKGGESETKDKGIRL